MKLIRFSSVFSFLVSNLVTSINRCFSLIVFVCSLAAGILAQAPTVEKVEPPNWWAGHGVDTLRPSVFDFNLWKASTDVFT